jgi:UDP-N-acetylmuramoyl-tripeptide--D-alanyl-D-alanine ligase
MVLLGLRDEHRIAVVEVGTSSRGEIAHGGAITRPDVAVLTLVAAAHTEGLGTLDDVATEKGALLAALGPSGIAVANADDQRAAAQLSRVGGPGSLRYGTHPEAEVRLLARSRRGQGGQELSVLSAGTELTISTPLLGTAGAYATLAALAVARALGHLPGSGDAITRALAPLATEADGRLSARTLGDGTVLVDDSYNANGASMRASITAAAELASDLGRRLVLVLGDMRELGALSREEHAAVGRAAAEAAPAVVVAVGREALALADAVDELGLRALRASDADEAASVVAGVLQAGDVVLVKGSRGVRLERVVARLSGEGQP